MKIKYSLMIASMLLVFGGCGGDSGTPSSESDTKTGFVGDGYIEGAYVCHDSNSNMSCLDETYATTLADGSFTLSNFDSTKELLAQIPVGSIDHGPFADGSTSSRTISTEVLYYYPANGSNANDKVFISPISALISAQMKAMPALSLSDAKNIISSNIGVSNSLEILDNYLEKNSTQSNTIHQIAEVIHSSIESSSAQQTSTYANTIDYILGELNDISAEILDANSSDFNASNHIVIATPKAGNNTPLIYTPVADICADLTNKEYFAFEDWDSNQGGGYIEKRELKNIFIDQNDILQIKNEVYNSGWSINTQQTTFEQNYLNNIDETIINMAQVNSTNYTKPMHDVPLPAQKISCSGSSAIFNANGFKYKLIASQADINGITGTNLPYGSTIGSIINPITFDPGDKIYKILAIIQDDIYGVDNNEIVHNDATFTPMNNSANISSMVQSTNTSFLVEFQDSNNYTKLKLVTTASSQNNGVVNVIRVENSNITSSTTKTYHVEVHNSHPFFVVENYKGVGFDLFLGKVDAIDSSNFVYGSIIRTGLSFYFTQGGIQAGDILDDILLNQSAKNRVLSAKNITHP